MQTLILLNLRKIRKLVNFMRIPLRPIVNTYFWFNVNTDSGLEVALRGIQLYPYFITPCVNHTLETIAFQIP